MPNLITERCDSSIRGVLPSKNYHLLLCYIQFSFILNQVASSTYPCKEVSSLSPEDLLLNDINYQIRQFMRGSQDCKCTVESSDKIDTVCYNCGLADYELEDNEFLVSLAYFMRFKKIHDKITLDKLR